MTSSLLSRPSEEGARLLALSFLDQAAQAWPRLADPANSADTEALHDFRVALRRLRSCLRAYRSHLEDSIPRKLAKRLKRLAASTGPGRDTEVQIEWLQGRRPHLAVHHRAGLAWLLARLEERMRDAREEMREEIEHEFLKVEEELRRRLSVYHTEIHLDPASPRETLGGATAALLRRQVADLEAHLARVEDPEDEEEAHEARISAKRVRYLLEPFAGEIEGAAPVVKGFKTLQDLLGDLHDAHVLETELAGAVETAAAERARRVLELSLAQAPDDRFLRAERRRDRESGLISLARLNRARRDRLFEALEAEWLAGKAHDFLRQVEGLPLDTPASPPVDSVA
ncbi:MAG TPA: CHAD domain-containing protein [Thermoanaerobaculia bacterium]|jgi:CHAD domain-containing protein|nr:CHAD domain-containing protein [Thermoanaerobaculia bacterium]